MCLNCFASVRNSVHTRLRHPCLARSSRHTNSTTLSILATPHHPKFKSPHRRRHHNFPFSSFPFHPRHPASSLQVCIISVDISGGASLLPYKFWNSFTILATPLCPSPRTTTILKFPPTAAPQFFILHHSLSTPATLHHLSKFALSHLIFREEQASSPTNFGTVFQFSPPHSVPRLAPPQF